MAKSSKAPYIAGAALLALLLFSGSANAAEPPLPGKKPDGIKPPVSEPPLTGNEPADEPPPVAGEWGVIPPGLIPSFRLAEQASGIAGIGKFFAVKAWQAARAGQPILSPLEAAAWAASHPTLAQNYQNGGDAGASFRVLERNTLPKGEVGPYGGVGSYAAGKTWPKPAYYSEWGEIGAAGLFDMLGGVVVYSGIHNEKFAPLLKYHANIMYRVDVQLFAAGYYVYRLLHSEKYPIFSRANGDPVKLWSGVAACWLTPDGFAQKPNGSQDAQDAAARFIARAKECGIDLSTLPIPGYMKQVWPGAAAYYKALGVAP